MTHPQTLSKRMTPEPLRGHDPASTTARLGLAVALAALALACGRRPGARLVALRSLVWSINAGGPAIPFVLRRVWRVNAQGRVAPFPYRFPNGHLGSVQGSTAPTPSPDGRWIAFGSHSEDYDIHLLDARTLQQRRITRLGRPPTIRSVSVDVLIAGWSPDSRRILLDVTRGEDTSEEGDLKVPPAFYGFLEYDLGRRKLISVALPKGFEFVAWLRDGRMVGVIPGRLPRYDKVVVLRPGEAGETPIPALAGWNSDAQASADGKWLTGIHAEGGCPSETGMARVVKVNLATLAVTPLVTLSSCSGNERPALSPNDKQVAYKREMRIVNHNPQETLFLDRRQIYACPGMIDYKWVDERIIALACVDEVLTLDTKTTKVLSRYRVAAPRARR